MMPATVVLSVRLCLYVSYTWQLVLVASRSVSGSTKLDSHEAILVSQSFIHHLLFLHVHSKPDKIICNNNSMIKTSYDRATH